MNSCDNPQIRPRDFAGSNIKYPVQPNFSHPYPSLLNPILSPAVDKGREQAKIAMNNNTHVELGEAMCGDHRFFNWDRTDTCVLFSWWRIDSVTSLFFSCLLVFVLAATYEYLRDLARHYDDLILDGELSRIRDQLEDGSGEVARLEEETGLVVGGKRSVRLSQQQHLSRSILYAFLVFLAFFLVGVFLTFNAFLIASVVLGAGAGYYAFGRDSLHTARPMQGDD
ncbi:Ctr copper transporter family-domain-containing protein [Jimgerdemannia flammicorona]|uniref:Copper transport protein n=1 Tax=Jimgerdemannia flammicorona TaxID=994334 RepID=A0A433DFR8_9FUNG|nr:Ctr copper transporter family-domain-containing protein [Jimgerdemannia flammicorona]